MNVVGGHCLTRVRQTIAEGAEFTRSSNASTACQGDRHGCSEPGTGDQEIGAGDA